MPLRHKSAQKGQADSKRTEHNKLYKQRLRPHGVLSASDKETAGAELKKAVTLLDRVSVKELFQKQRCKPEIAPCSSCVIV
jgi:ribosomal protein S20